MQLAEFTKNTPPDHPLAETIRDIVRDANRLAPRSQQTAVGPSEIGQPCARRLACRLMGAPQVNTTSDPWAAILGTSAHAWLAEAFTTANQRLGRTRFLVEQRVQIRQGLVGSCDLFDVDTFTVIDHKVIGETMMSEYKKNGPPAQYRAQAHLYGMGFERLGLPVREVALAFYPRAGMLAGLHVWSEPYSPAVAEAALARHDQILELACAFGVDEHPDRYQLIPRTPSHACNWCPWFQPGPDTGVTCPGHLPEKTPANPAE